MEQLVDATMAKWLQAMVSRSRNRAHAAGLGHTLPDDYAALLYQRQSGLCAISKLKFSLAVFPGVLVKHPFAPSLDRTLSSGGYDPDNVRLVCIAVNFAMGQWGQKLYMTFARAAVVLESSTDTCLPLGLNPPLPAPPSHLGMADVEKDNDWIAQQRERISAAEAVAATLKGVALRNQIRHLAALKRNLTVGPDGLRQAAMKAVQTRKENAQSSVTSANR
jgi:hypothetical protein